MSNTVYLYGDIGGDFFNGITTAQFAIDIDAAATGQGIIVAINTAGGSVVSGLGIYETIINARRLGHRVVTRVDGVAASIGAVIAMAGDEVQIGEGSLLMIHKPWVSGVEGDSVELQKTVVSLEAVEAKIVDIFVKKTGQPRAKIEAMLSKESWMDAAEAVRLRFADTINYDRVEAAATYDYLSRLSVPDDKLAAARRPVEAAMSRVMRGVTEIHHATSYEASICARAKLKSAAADFLDQNGVLVRDLENVARMLDTAATYPLPAECDSFDSFDCN